MYFHTTIFYYHSTNSVSNCNSNPLRQSEYIPSSPVVPGRDRGVSMGRYVAKMEIMADLADMSVEAILERRGVGRASSELDAEAVDMDGTSRADEAIHAMDGSYTRLVEELYGTDTDMAMMTPKRRGSRTAQRKGMPT